MKKAYESPTIEIIVLDDNIFTNSPENDKYNFIDGEGLFDS